MNLIAIRGFKNVESIKDIIKFLPGHAPVDDAGEAVDGRHPEGVHKGALFTIGQDRPFDDLSDKLKLIVLQLRHAKCIGETDGDKGKALVEKINKEVAKEQKDAKDAKDATASGSLKDLMNQLLTLGWKPPVTPPTAPVKAPPATPPKA